jgi:maltooligosyltrehalose synthase
VCCEIKPTLGDDYPNVLRKLKIQIDLTNNDKTVFEYWKQKYVLIIGTYTSTTVSKKELIEIFGQTGIKIVFTSEIIGQTKRNMIQPVNIEQAKFDTTALEEEFRLLKERNTQLEEEHKILKERNTQLEEEIRLLKECKKPGKSITDYFDKK